MANCLFFNRKLNKCILGFEQLSPPDTNVETHARSFEMGFGDVTKNKSEAGIKLLKRDFPDVMANTQSEVHFIPVIFKSKCEKVLRYQENKWPQKEGADYLNLENLKSVTRGDQTERWLYENMEDFFHQNPDKQIAVFHQVPFQNGECDFVIISKTLRIIIILEVKYTFNKGKVSSTIKQCQRGFENIKSVLGGVHLKGWRCAKVAIFEEISKDGLQNVCPECQKFILTKSSNFSDLWASLSKENVEQKSSEDYQNIFAKLLMICKSQILSYSKATDDVHKTLTEVTSSPESIMFWTNDQYNVLKDQAMRNVIFSSVYGSGKTELLIAKMQQIITQLKEQNVLPFPNEESMFIDYDEEDKDDPKIFYFSCINNKYLMEDRQKLEIIDTVKGRLEPGYCVMRSIKPVQHEKHFIRFIEVLSQRQVSIFIDECSKVFYDRISEILKSTKIRCNHMWIAMTYKDAKNSDLFLETELCLGESTFLLPKLCGNLRNSKFIARAVFGDEQLAGENLPTLHRPRLFITKNDPMSNYHQALKEAIKWIRPLTDDVIHILIMNSSRVNVLLFVEFTLPHLDFGDEIIDKSRLYPFQQVGDEIIDISTLCLQKQDGDEISMQPTIEEKSKQPTIVMNYAENFNGATAKSVIIVFLQKMSKQDSELDIQQNFSRATTNLAIVGHKDDIRGEQVKQQLSDGKGELFDVQEVDFDE